MASLKHKSLDFKFLLIIFLLAMGYRIIGLQVLGEHPLFMNPVVDAGYHHGWAQRIANGDWLGQGPDDVFKPPLYSYILALVYMISDKNIVLMQCLQLLLGSFSCVFTAVIASRLLNVRTGIIAGLSGALYAPFLFFELQLLTPAFSIFFNLLAFLFLTTNMDKGFLPLKRNIVSAGFFFGLSACVRPDVLLPALLSGLFIIFMANGEKTAKKTIHYCLLILTILLVISPVTLRNFHITRAFIPISSNAGINFYIGNRTGADGISAMPVGLRWERLVSSVPQDILEKPSKASRLWTKRTFLEITREPGEEWRRIGKKALAFFNFQEFRNNISFYFLQQQSALLCLPFFQYSIILPLALAGMFSMLGKKKIYLNPIWIIGTWTGGFFLAGVVFFVNARFRLPAIPFIIISAAFCVNEFLSDLKHKNYIKFSFHFFVFMAAILLINHQWFPFPEKSWARDYVNLGNASRNGGQYEKSEDAYQNALKIKNDPDAHFMMARILFGKRDYYQSLDHVHQGLTSIPDSPDLLLLQARIYLALKENTDAIKSLHQFLDLAGTCNMYPKRNEWAQVHILLSDLEPFKKDEHWKQAWRISPVTTAEISFIRGKKDKRILEIFKKEALAKTWDWYSQANYGMALLRAGRFKTAGLILGKAVNMAPEKKGLQKFLDQAIYFQQQ